MFLVVCSRGNIFLGLISSKAISFQSQYSCLSQPYFSPVPFALLSSLHLSNYQVSLVQYPRQRLLMTSTV